MPDREERPDATKIVVLTNMYPPQHLGGYELSCRDTVRRWRERGHHVTVVTSDLHLRDSPDEETVHRDLRFYWDDHEIISPPLRTRVAIERHNQRTFADVLDATAPDVVSVWHMGAMSLGLLTSIAQRGLPIVFVVCDDWLLYGRDVDAWMRFCRRSGPIGRVLARSVGLPSRVELHTDTAYCFVSDWIRRRALARAPWDLGRTTVVYSGIERADFPGDAGESRPWTWRLAYVGRVEERKGVHIALEALAQLPPPATLDVVGPGDEAYVERLRKQAEQLDVTDRVHFSAVGRDQLREVYRRSNVLLFPVLWPEPFGLVPLEAMACGTPVVATATGGSSEFLFDGVNCLVTPPGDAEALARATQRLHDDPMLRDRLVGAGRVTADHLDSDTLAEVLESWHEAAVGRFRQTPADRDALSVTLARLTAD